MGQPGKFGWCGAEAELAGMQGWESAEEPIVWALAVSGMIEIVYEFDYDDELLLDYLGGILVPMAHIGMGDGEPARSPAVVLAPEHARVFATAGYSRRDVALKLRERCLLGGGRGACRTLVYVMGGVGRKSVCLLPWSGGSLAGSSPVPRPGEVRSEGEVSVAGS